MGEQERIIKEWAESMVNKYDWLIIKYEYNEERKVFLVSYYPEKLIANNEEFAIDAMRFEDDLNLKYGIFSPLFCDEESLFKLSSKATVIEAVHSSIIVDITIDTFPYSPKWREVSEWSAVNNNQPTFSLAA